MDSKLAFFFQFWEFQFPFATFEFHFPSSFVVYVRDWNRGVSVVLCFVLKKIFRQLFSMRIRSLKFHTHVVKHCSQEIGQRGCEVLEPTFSKVWLEVGMVLGVFQVRKREPFFPFWIITETFSIMFKEFFELLDVFLVDAMNKVISVVLWKKNVDSQGLRIRVNTLFIPLQWEFQFFEQK